MAIHFLVVDDAAFVRDTIKRSLRKFIPGVEISDAADGRRAVSALKTKKIDIILSDWEMPEMSGEEFLRWVREQDAYAEIPFIMITSRGDRDHVMKAIQAGVNDYISKPFTPDELQKKVTKQLVRIGYDIAAVSRAGPQTNTGFGSVDVLTGAGSASATSSEASRSSSEASKASASTPTANMGSAESKTKVKAKAPGKAQLRFPKLSYQAAVRDVTLQGLMALMARPEQIPHLFDSLAVDIEDKNGDVLARLNAVIVGIQAKDLHPESQYVQLQIRFVDNDPVKCDALSKYIAGG